MGWPKKWVVTNPARTTKDASDKREELVIPINYFTPKSFKVSDQYCPIWKMIAEDGDASAHVRNFATTSTNLLGHKVYDYQSLYINTNLVEPKTLKFNLKAYMNGHALYGATRVTSIPVEVEIRGCPGETQTITIPGKAGSWDTHQQNIHADKKEMTITLPDPTTWAYSNQYCPFVKYHIYQDYPTLLEKMQGHYSCGPIASEEVLSTIVDLELTFRRDNWQYRLATCQKKCNDDANCKRFAFGKVGAADEHKCYLYNSDTCGYVKNSGEKRIYIPSKLTKDTFFKSFDGSRTEKYTTAKDGSFWFQLGVETVGGHIQKFPSQMKIMSPKEVATGKRCEEHTTNLLTLVSPRTLLQCNELCVKHRECDSFNHNDNTKQCELQKKGYCKKMVDDAGWNRYEETEHEKVPSFGR